MSKVTDQVTEKAQTKPVYKPIPPDGLANYDKVTQLIWKLLAYIPISGKPMLANMYFASPMLYNFMMVGASGVIVSYLIFSMLFRPLMYLFIAGSTGEFLAYVMTTLAVFMWNFTWNKKWALGFKSQILKMTPQELSESYELIGKRLYDK